MSLFEKYFVFIENTPDESLFPYQDKKIIDVIEELRPIFKFHTYLVFTQSIIIKDHLISSDYNILLILPTKTDQIQLSIHRNTILEDIKVKIIPNYGKYYV